MIEEGKFDPEECFGGLDVLRFDMAIAYSK